VNVVLKVDSEDVRFPGKDYQKLISTLLALQVQRLPCEPRGVHQAYQHQGKYRICSFVRGFCGEKLKAIFFKKQTNNKIGLSVDFVLTVTSSMYGRDPTPILPPTQHLCMQPTSTTHSHPPNGMSANFKIVFPKYSPQSHQQGRSRLDGVPSVYHNLGALPIIASVSLTPIPCLFACFCESVSCEYAFFSTCF